MGWIDQAKNIRSHLTDALLPAPVVFHHVPKCGGTSVGRALRKRYLLSQATVTPESSFRAFEAFTARTDRESMLVDVLDLREQMLLYHLYEEVRCVSAHVRFSPVAHARFADRYAFVTMLREPVSRFISHYFWSHGRAGAHARIEETFEPFLDSPRARRLGATYVEYFAGMPKEAGLDDTRAIARAVAHLRTFDVVGHLDDLPAFERGLKTRLGTRIRIGHENRMRQPSSRREDIVTPALLERVRVLCAPDIAVWEAVRSSRPPEDRGQ